MAIFSAKPNSFLDEFDEEQRIYATAAAEFDDGVSHPELRAKVLTEANENPDFARTLFIEKRSHELMQEKIGKPEDAEILPEKPSPETPVTELPTGTVQSRHRIRKYGGYFLLSGGFLLVAVGMLYISLGGVRTGISFLLPGCVVVATGIGLLMFSGNRTYSG